MRRIAIICLFALAAAGKVLPAGDGIPVGFERAKSRFSSEFGKASSAAPNCYRANDRYVACFNLWDGGELAQVSVVPEEWIGNGSFDREGSLSKGEYLDILAKVSRIRPLGTHVSEDRALAYAVTNGGYTSDDEWEEAVVSRFVNAGDETVRSFAVLYFAKVGGEVVWNRPADCQPVGDLGLPFGCREPELGPVFLSIDGSDYHLAPSDQKLYLVGQKVDVMAVNPERRNHKISEITILKKVAAPKVAAP